MKNEIITQWNKDIIRDTSALKQSITFFNIYQQINFFQNFFDKNCLIRITTGHIEGIIQFIVGNKNKNHTCLTNNDLYAEKVSCSLPPHFNAYDNKHIAFRNNPEGFEEFAKTVLVDHQLAVLYKATIMDKSLVQHDYSTPKSVKI